MLEDSEGETPPRVPATSAKATRRNNRVVESESESGSDEPGTPAPAAADDDLAARMGGLSVQPRAPAARIRAGNGRGGHW